MTRARILFVIGSLGRGGAEKQLHLLLKHLDRERFAPRVVSLSVGGPWPQRIRELGVPVTELPRQRSFELARLRALIRIVRETAPHILQTLHALRHDLRFRGRAHARRPCAHRLAANRARPVCRARLDSWSDQQASLALGGRDHLQRRGHPPSGAEEAVCPPRGHPERRRALAAGPLARGGAAHSGSPGQRSGRGQRGTTRVGEELSADARGRARGPADAPAGHLPLGRWRAAGGGAPGPNPAPRPGEEGSTHRRTRRRGRPHERS